MINKYLDRYYTNRITASKIAELEGISDHKIGKEFRAQGLPTVNQLIKNLDFEDSDLRRVLRGKYTSIANRCIGSRACDKTTYKGLYYLPLPDYVDFCNSNKKTIMSIWNKYIDSEKELRLALSVDRIDSNKGYSVDNMQFVTLGYNSYKSNINPCKVVHKGEKYYFMSAVEGSKYFGIRKQDIGECMRGERRRNKDFDAYSTDMDIVLRKNNMSSLKEYYDKLIDIG